MPSDCKWTLCPSPHVGLTNWYDLRGHCFGDVTAFEHRAWPGNKTRRRAPDSRPLHFPIISALNTHRRLDLNGIHSSLELMAGSTDLSGSNTRTASSPQSLQSVGQQTACLACREAKQRCTKGVPWYAANTVIRAVHFNF